MVIYRNLKLLKDEIESIIKKLGHPEYLIKHYQERNRPGLLIESHLLLFFRYLTITRFG